MIGVAKKYIKLSATEAASLAKVVEKPSSVFVAHERHLPPQRSPTIELDASRFR